MRGRSDRLGSTLVERPAPGLHALPQQIHGRFAAPGCGVGTLDPQHCEPAARRGGADPGRREPDEQIAAARDTGRGHARRQHPQYRSRPERQALAQAD